jgi:hypothetical protein
MTIYVDFESVQKQPSVILHLNSLHEKGDNICYWSSNQIDLSGKNPIEQVISFLNKNNAKYSKVSIDKPQFDMFVGECATNIQDWV